MKQIAILTLAVATTWSIAAFAMGGYGGGMGSMQMTIRHDEYGQALQLIRHEEYAEAIPHLDHALADHPHNADILNYLGFTHRMVGEYQLSLEFYQKALAEDPDHKGAHEYLGELYLNMHDLTNANLQMAELVRLCPDSCDERDALTKAIAEYQTANPPATSGTPAAPAAPAASQSAATTPPASQ